MNWVGIINYELNNKHELFDKWNDTRIATFLPKYSLVASTGLSPVTDQFLNSWFLPFLLVTGIKIQNYISIIRPLRNINRLCLLSKRWASNFASMLCQNTYANAEEFSLVLKTLIESRQQNWDLTKLFHAKFIYVWKVSYHRFQ